MMNHPPLNLTAGAVSSPVSNGEHVEKLHSAETWDCIPDLEGQEFRDFNVWAKACGHAAPASRRSTWSLLDGTPDITFASSVENSEIKATEIISLPRW